MSGIIVITGSRELRLEPNSDGRVFTRRITDFYQNFEPVEVGQ